MGGARRSRRGVPVTLVGLIGGAAMALGSPRAVAAIRDATPPASTLPAYFSGAWQCRGAFANGRAIESVDSFAPILDGRWLAYHHADRPPNRYRARGIWSAEAAQPITVVVADNFGGLRRFTGPAWDGRIVDLVYRAADSAPSGARADAPAERFVYERLDADHYRVTYSRVVGGVSQLGDSLTCARGKS